MSSMARFPDANSTSFFLAGILGKESAVMCEPRHTSRKIEAGRVYVGARGGTSRSSSRAMRSFALEESKTWLPGSADKFTRSTQA
jgi:hypothetical protein